VEGKIRAIQHARETGLPFFGICLGMQCAAIEFARNVLGLKDAHTSEFAADTPHPVIHLMSDQRKVHELGGTMRLGSYPCRVKPGSLAHRLYGAELVHERHRHRYEFNNGYRERFESAGMTVSGVNPERDLVEMLELAAHSFFIGVQFHPEFKSRPLTPQPLFDGFVAAARERSRSRARRGEKTPQEGPAALEPYALPRPEAFVT
jgi:CTP synthase